MEDRTQDRVTDHELSYERPSITDHGTLLDLTLAGGAPNADVQNGPDGTAFSPAP